MSDTETAPVYVRKPAGSMGELCAEVGCRRAADIKPDTFAPWLCTDHYIGWLETELAAKRTELFDMCRHVDRLEKYKAMNPGLRV